MMKKSRVVFTDVCYVCGKKVIGYEDTYNKTWVSNFKGLTAHTRCLNKEK